MIIHKIILFNIFHTLQLNIILNTTMKYEGKETPLSQCNNN